jgi:hypothetical protein
MEVECNRPNLKVELVDENGNVIPRGWTVSRSGSYVSPGTVALPMESSIRFSLECRNWGISKDSYAMVSTDSGAWSFSSKEKGKIFLRATLTGEKANPYWKRWHGEIQTPVVAVDWD